MFASSKMSSMYTVSTFLRKGDGTDFGDVSDPLSDSDSELATFDACDRCERAEELSLSYIEKCTL